jgi:hypothetical protein
MRRKRTRGVEDYYYFLFGLIEGTVTAKVLSSRNLREKEDGIIRKPAVPRTNVFRFQNPPRAGIELAA